MKTFTPPGSKSYTNRALIIAALADGISTLHNVLFSDDTEYMIAALEALGIQIERKGTTLCVHGTNGKLKTPNKELYVGNSGTSIRFLASILPLVHGSVTINGNERMQERPINPLVESLRHMRLHVLYGKQEGYPPITLESSGIFPGGKISMDGSLSSQYFSGLMMAAPLAEQETEISVIGELVSKPYIDLTIEIMQAFGAVVENNNYSTFIIPPRQSYQPTSYTIEPDASSASYFFAAAVLMNTPLRIEHLGRASKQGDLMFVQLLERLGASIRWEDHAITVHSSANPLKPLQAYCAPDGTFVLDMHHCSDMVPTMAIVAATLDGQTTMITNVANIRIKETDRIAAMATELKKLGIEVEEVADGLTIHGKDPYALHKNVSIATYDDHRIAMSFAVLRLLEPSIIIENPACVAKTYPGFWDDFGTIF